ncbi:MAG: hypothetical protein AMS18_00305 [Gemmatimonas sp. SG8_17]|nr:MAG: hypothetical protein AMS18_00305 [Gemmatimonas sp. SG8_17]
MNFETLSAGDRLPNGGVIALAGPIVRQDGCFPARIVLCELPESLTKYVTWMCWIDNERVACAWGDYCVELDDALEAFAEKRKRLER